MTFSSVLFSLRSLTVSSDLTLSFSFVPSLPSDAIPSAVSLRAKTISDLKHSKTMPKTKNTAREMVDNTPLNQ